MCKLADDIVAKEGEIKVNLLYILLYIYIYLVILNVHLGNGKIIAI